MAWRLLPDSATPTAATPEAPMNDAKTALGHKVLAIKNHRKLT